MGVQDGLHSSSKCVLFPLFFFDMFISHVFRDLNFPGFAINVATSRFNGVYGIFFISSKRLVLFFFSHTLSVLLTKLPLNLFD